MNVTVGPIVGMAVGAMVAGGVSGPLGAMAFLIGAVIVGVLSR